MDYYFGLYLLRIHVGTLYVEIEIGLRQVCEKEGIKEVADLVQGAIKVNKKIVIVIVIDGGVTNAIITLTNTIKAIKG